MKDERPFTPVVTPSGAGHIVRASSDGQRVTVIVRTPNRLQHQSFGVHQIKINRLHDTDARP